MEASKVGHGMKTSKTGMLMKLYKVKIVYIYIQYGTSILLTTQPDMRYELNKKNKHNKKY
jgi:hypothetical protein